MSGLLDGKRALVFGANDGIGAAVAERFRREGAKTFLAAAGGDCRYEANPGEVRDVLDAGARALGGLDAVVDAYLEWWVGQLDESDDAQWRGLVERNLTASLIAAREGFRRLADGGNLCSLSCLWAAGASPELGLTGASKAGLGPIIKSLALRGVPRRIRANLVSVGLIDTPKMRSIAEERARAAGKDPHGAFDRAVAKTAMARAGTPDEVGKVMTFLCANRAKFITGQTVLVDGGLLWA